VTRETKLFLVALAVPFGLVAWGTYRVVQLIGKAHPSNVGGKRTAKVDVIVVHTTEGSAASALAWFGMDHAPSGKGPSSAHYIVSRTGKVTQVVPEDRIAWHASDSAVNGRSIGIECEGAAAKPETWTPELLSALVTLSAQVVNRYGIAVQRGTPGIIGHSDVAAAARTGKVDPGPHFPWLTYLERVRATAQGIA
jgi:N-acetyl-anhydromuramyl-L-alanine amidase AmpD